MVQGLPVIGEPGFNGYHPLSASTYYFVGYTHFLAAIYAMFGHDRVAVRVIQAVVGAATVGVVYLVGYWSFGRRPGLTSALLTAIYLPLVYYAGLLLTETWFTFLQMGAVALWMRACAAGSGADSQDARPNGRMSATHLDLQTGAFPGLVLAVAAGLTAGLACLNRATFVLGLALLAVGGLFCPPVPMPQAHRVARVAAFLLAAGAVIAPITVRNYQIHGRFFLISTNGPSTFLTGHVTHVPSLPPGLPPGTTDAEMADRHRTISLNYLRRHWGTYLAEIPEFFEIIWTNNDFWPGTVTAWERTPDSGKARIDIHVHSRGSPPFGQATYFPDLIRYVDRLVWGLIGLPMGLMAMVFLPRGHRRWTPLYLALVPYIVIPFIASAFPRYRMPAVPLVFVLAGQSLVACWDHRSRQPGNRRST
jgi:4-amino-4-deoxy-L-arabinose transferase-like glycosyltransferase